MSGMGLNTTLNNHWFGIMNIRPSSSSYDSQQNNEIIRSMNNKRTKLLTSLAFLLVFQMISFTAHSQCDWQNLGPSDINTLDNEGQEFSDFVLDNNDHAYQVIRDGAENEKATVRKFNGVDFQVLGNPGFSIGQVSYNSIAVDGNNDPYVAYCDQGSGDKAIVKKFDGTNWIQVGTELSVGQAAFTSLAIDGNNIPYVAFKDANAGNKITVVKFDGTNWVTLGTAGFSAGTADYVSLAIDNLNTPYVVYQDGANANKSTVQKFDGTNWVAVGSEGFSTGTAAYLDLSINSSGEPYVIFVDTDNNNETNVFKFDGVNWLSIWSLQSEGSFPSIAIAQNDNPFIVFLDYQSSNVRVFRFDESNGNWYTVWNNNFSLGWQHTSIQIASDGNPYIGFHASGEVTLWRNLNSNWEMLGVPGFSTGKSNVSTSLALSKTGIPYVAFGDKTRSGDVLVKRFVGGEWERVGNALFHSSGSGNESFAIALDTNDVPYIVYRSNSYNIKVQKFDGTNWTYLPHPTIGSENAKGNFCDIAIDRKTNIPYISYRSGNSFYSNDYNKPIVLFFDEANQYWTSGNSLAGNISFGLTYETSLAIDTNSIRYIAFRDFDAGNKVVVRRLIQTTSSWPTWSNVGPTYTISAGNAVNVELVISPDNTPYVVYKDVSLGNLIVVQKFNGTSWELVGQPGFSGGEAHNTALEIDAGGTPYVSFADDTQGGKLSVMKYNGSGWIHVGSPGLSGDQVYDAAHRYSTKIAVDDSGTVYTAYWNNGYTASKKLNSLISVEERVVCSSELPVIWNGENRNDSGTFQYITTDIEGCDSTATLFLTVNEPSFGTDTIVACESYTWIDNNIYTENNNTATHVIPGGAVNGCDSIVTLDLTINEPSTTTDAHLACETFTWIDGNTYTESNNTATYTLTNSNNCDSIITLDLTILNSNSTTDVQTSCGSYTWINGTTYTSSNNSASHTFTGSNGCDSIVYLDLTILPTATGTDVQTSCEPYTWINGSTYSSSTNNVSHVLSGGAANGCDSIVTLNLTVINMNPSVIDNSDYLSPSFQSGDTYEWIDCDTEQTIYTGMDFYPAESGSYKVKIHKEGCEEISSCYNYSALGLDDLSKDTFVVYPNPTRETLFIEGAKVESLRILMLGGKEVLTNRNQNQIDVSLLSSGLYLIEVNNSNIKLFSKL